LKIDDTFVVPGTIDQLNLFGSDLLVDARAVLLGGQRGLHRTTNGFFLLKLLRRYFCAWSYPKTDCHFSGSCATVTQLSASGNERLVETANKST
jgi:hypothetical protein